MPISFCGKRKTIIIIKKKKRKNKRKERIKLYPCYQKDSNDIYCIFNKDDLTSLNMCFVFEMIQWTTSFTSPFLTPKNYRPFTLFWICIMEEIEIHIETKLDLLEYAMYTKPVGKYNHFPITNRPRIWFGIFLIKFENEQVREKKTCPTNQIDNIFHGSLWVCIEWL